MADSLKDLESMHVIVAEFRKISKANREVLQRMLSKEHDVIGDKVDDPTSEIKERYLAMGGRSNATFIPAIKEVREKTGIGLAEAKRMVESW